MDEARPPAEFELGESFAAVLTETTQSLVCVSTARAAILLFNDACERATGFTREEVLGRDARDFVIPPEEREAFGEFLAYVWKTGSPSPQVGHWQTKAGGRLLIAWSNKPMTGADGAPADAGHDRDRPDRPRAARRGRPRAAGRSRRRSWSRSARLATEQRALRRVATLVAAEVSPERVFTAVSEECARVLQVNASAVLRYDGDETATIVGRHNRDSIDVLPRRRPRWRRTRARRSAACCATGAPARIDDWGGVASGEIAEAIFRVGYRSSAAAPIVVAGALWGAVAIASEDPLPHDAEQRLGAFCELVSLAVASAQARADLIASRARLVKAGDEQRRRLERNLHDGAQQRLVSVAVKLRVARAQLRARRRRSRRSCSTRRCSELGTGLEELREIARGLHPAILGEHGLRRALEALAERLPVEVEIEAPDERLPAHIEATAYYIVSEALTNVAKHADAGERARDGPREGDVLRCTVTDDGRGGADPPAAAGSSACATVPRRPAGRCRWSARRAAAP